MQEAELEFSFMPFPLPFLTGKMEKTKQNKTKQTNKQQDELRMLLVSAQIPVT